MNLSRDTATTWATWFRALGDPSRILLLNLLATAERPLSVGEMTERLDIGQSTISHHLKQLAEVGFVLVEERGTSNLYRVNERCLDCFPTAAELVMGLARTTAEWRAC
ncbi:MAG TPA: metalloregulator ArsR/SmtB family transcription factor [Acidimicrobiia bacterium]|nr:metalloregulator ArsR/SmtB family transcription factor [Acidimicrobiia bacterium]